MWNDRHIRHHCPAFGKNPKNLIKNLVIDCFNECFMSDLKKAAINDVEKVI